jgi:FtsP/CotA-like multicopper oxidase with cupredoxin domain
MVAASVRSKVSFGALAAIFLSAAAPAQAAPAAFQPAREALAPPLEYRSQNGVLAVTLEAKETRVRLGDRTIDAATYNGSYGGPVLRLKPGDTLRMHFINHLRQITNLHFHGLAVSPLGHGDDAMHMIAPGESWDFVIPIPKDHPPGVYWFHTHGHDFAERQVMAGLSGTIVIEGFQDEVPATRGLTEHLFALKEFYPDRAGKLDKVPKPVGENFLVRSIQGQVNPRIDIRPGETQLWRFSGQTADSYVRLRLAGHSMTVIGRDSRPLLHPETVKEVIIGPAERADVLVTAGAAGQYPLVAESAWTGPAGDRFPPRQLADMVVSPDPTRPPPAPLGALTINAPDQKPVPADHIDARRLIVFSEDALVTGLFFINHQTFDPERADVRVPLGNIEEWTIRNSSEELHVFHIHQLPFQTVSINGKAVPFQGLTDTVDIPIHGEVVIRLAFTNPLIVGRFMFHCHILEHEDKGMMAQVEVYDPHAPAMAAMAGMHDAD